MYEFLIKFHHRNILNAAIASTPTVGQIITVVINSATSCGDEDRSTMTDEKYFNMYKKSSCQSVDAEKFHLLLTFIPQANLLVAVVASFS